jgi:serine-type anaerobic sulfatase-maturating enzyme
MSLDPSRPSTRDAILTARPAAGPVTGPAVPDPRPAGAPLGFHLLAKPTGAVCNLDCSYCFFLSKEALYPGSSFRMADDVHELYIRQLLEAHRTPVVTIAWQGGEPTLMGLDFFRRSMELVERHRQPGQHVEHTIQTNGTRLDAEWAAFFREHRFLVGLSMDGPPDIHDTYRVDKGGKPTHARVLAAARLLAEHGVDVNILCTVHAANEDRGLEVYRYFRDEVGARFLQFIPIVERATEATLPAANAGWGTSGREVRPLYTLEGSLVTERSVSADGWGRFMTAIYDEWLRRDVGTVFVQLFDAALASWVGAPPAVCIFGETCGQALALEHTGDVYSCDHFVEPRFRLGNIRERHLLELVASPQQRAFGEAKRDTLPQYCRECPVRFACHGECPRNRFIETPDGEAGLNYLCAGYRSFFGHIDGSMRLMAGLLRQGRFADEVMGMLDGG